MLVGVRGFEPPTPASRTQYSTRLSYTPNPKRTTRGVATRSLGLVAARDTSGRDESPSRSSLTKKPGNPRRGADSRRLAPRRPRLPRQPPETRAPPLSAPPPP